MEVNWTAIVEEDAEGNAILTFPPESLEGLGWQEGDSIEWIDNNNGSWTLRKSMIEYEQQDYRIAKEIIGLGYLMDLDKKVLQATEENIVDVAKKYYTVRLRTFDPTTGTHL